MDASVYKRYLDFAFDAYQNRNITNQAYRQEGKVPYSNHPIWCATMLLHDTRLPLDLRETGFKALLLHDVLEDTSAQLPEWVEPEVARLVREMTFENFSATVAQLPDKEPFVKLLILVDKLSTLVEEHLRDDPQKRRLWIDTVRYLIAEAEKNYGRIRIVIIAQAIAAETEW